MLTSSTDHNGLVEVNPTIIAESFSSQGEEFKILFTTYGHDNHLGPSFVVTYHPIKLSIFMKFHEKIPNPYGIIAQTQNFTMGR